jgi:hypothetical protein
MKKVLVLSLVLFGFNNLKAQEYFNAVNSTNAKEEVFHRHLGFYLSMSIGPLFGNVTDNVDTYSMDMSGTGAQFDFKIGGAIKENLILHATLISNTLPGPLIKISGTSSTKASDNLTIGEAMFGGGLTYYIMPSNIFLSGTLGLGNFSIIDSNDKSNNVSTKQGFSMQLKIGKEWWVSKKWGLGISFTYGKTNLTNASDGIVEKLDSNRFGILFNSTFN